MRLHCKQNGRAVQMSPNLSGNLSKSLFCLILACVTNIDEMGFNVMKTNHSLGRAFSIVKANVICLNYQTWGTNRDTKYRHDYKIETILNILSTSKVKITCMLSKSHNDKTVC